MEEIVHPSQRDPRQAPYGFYLCETSGSWFTCWFESPSDLADYLLTNILSSTNVITDEKIEVLGEWLGQVSTWEELIKHKLVLEKFVLINDLDQTHVRFDLIKWPEPLESKVRFWVDKRSCFLNGLPISLRPENIEGDLLDKYIRYLRGAE